MPINLARQAALEGVRCLEQAPVELLVSTARCLALALAEGKTIFICGNGGSASQAQHFAAELVGRYLIERPGLPALALTTDTSILTAVGNDYGFEEIFVRQVQALMKPGDILWGLSTSGRSPNVLKAFTAARQSGGRILFMCGERAPEGVEADYIIPALSSETPRIQELHLFYGHTLCQLIEHFLFEVPGELGLGKA